MNEDRSARYHRLRRRTEVAGGVAVSAVLVTLLASGGSHRLREVAAAISMWQPFGIEEGLTAAVMAFLVFILLQFIDLPFAFYEGFVLERRYGLSTQSLGRWSIDHVKAAGLGAGLLVPGASMVYLSLRQWPDVWWIVSAGVFAAGLVGLLHLAPILLLPLFATCRPLNRPALTDRLVQLAARAQTRVGGVFEWGLSGHTRKANAALAGVGRTRRILLSDTLLSSYTDDEIEVVMAHELAHHVHGDLWRGMAAQVLALATGFYLANLALRSWEDVIDLRGLADPAGLPLLLLVGGACTVTLMPAINALSRSHERRADRYALEATGNPDAFISAMKRLSQQNLAEERPTALVRWFFYSHPPIRERLDAARTFATQAPRS